MSDLLTVRDVARFCQVHEVTVRRHIASGELRSVHVGKAVRVRKEDLDTYLDQSQNRDLTARQGLRKGRVLRRDDPIFGLIGIVNDPSSAWVSEDKHRALAEAYAPKP